MVPIPYRTPDTCDANEYFRTTNLSCALCGATQTPRSDRELFAALLCCCCITVAMVTNEMVAGLACTCPRGHHLVYSTGLCEKCSEQQVIVRGGDFSTQNLSGFVGDL